MYDAAVLAQRAIVPAVLTALAVGVYTDCRHRLIPNLLTFPLLALGLVLNTVSEGWPGLWYSLIGAAAGFGLMMIPYYFGQMGGGDVKLLAALGSLFGAYAILNIFLYTTLAGGVLALGYAVSRRQGVNSLRKAGQLALAPVTRTEPTDSGAPGADAITIPYGVAIAAGTLLYLALGKVV